MGARWMLAVLVIALAAAGWWFSTGREADAPRAATETGSRAVDAEPREPAVEPDALPAVRAPPDATKDATKDGATVTARVVDRGGRGVAGVAVRLEAEADADASRLGERTAASGADGSVAFAGVPAGIRLALAIGGDGVLAEATEAVALVPGERRDLGELLAARAASISGRVVGEDGLAIADVAVRASDGVPGRSAADGTYRIAGLSAGNTWLSAVKADFTLAKASRGAVALAEGEAKEGVDLVMLPDSPIFGTVRGVDGTPIAGAKVKLTAGPFAFDFLSQLEAETGADGRFAFADLPTDEAYALFAERAGYRQYALESVPRGREIDVMLERGVDLDVLVIDGGGAPLRPSRLALIRQWDSDASRMSTGDLVEAERSGTGVGPLEVEAGHYRIPIAKDGRFGVVAEAPGRVEARSDFVERSTIRAREPIVLRLESGGVLAGRVLDVGGIPVPGAQVKIAAERTGRATGSLRGRIRIIARDGTVGETTTDEAGRYRFAGLKPGRYSARAASSADDGPCSACAAAVVENGQQLEVDLTIAPRGAIEGEVLVPPGQTAADFLVVVQERGGDSGFARPDAAGHYRIAGIAPGDYRLDVGDASAGMGGFGGSSMPDWSKLASSYAIAVQGDATTRHDVDLRTDGFGSISGSAQVSGAPAAGLRVELRFTEDAWRDPSIAFLQLPEVRTAEDGRFEFPRVRAGRWRVVLHSGPRESPVAEDEVMVETGKTTSMRLAD